ncbi:MAG: peptidyl-prolyl cis-trans isomerase [Alphaproteobacteria bacterium]|nr:peptidyl-prolyl cis-trans isomerase [Alphaproteobacteria bacterium]MBU1515267.1 peptidyl-prolyl cis-trans isomerase [Alphaproteobacteria bacterium]MBU2092397.1 peptidyl-prolyl cis-trans isomerase [Alphaproteobacteria bacterium]MBU2152991.1 peptidyl-prolyl cis-trans isomerase [Alphaproteobacteria bacterium]MBU2305822.1 peptidyl-prolyl cis-trans isomerase [Alphaproteobacteria bacterium]
MIDLDRPAARDTRTGARGLKGRIARILREPLLHFFVVGLVLFGAGQAWRTAHDRHRIVVTPERVAELSEKYRLQFGQTPSPAELEGVVERYAREEALFREGVALGLDRDDEIVRRRIAQKVEFLHQDRALPATPSESRLETWFDAHAADYATPVRTSFAHLYFSPDRPGDPEARAKQALAVLQNGGAVEADPFPDQSEFVRLAPDAARRLFGDSDMARRLETAPLGAWSGPYRSGYGWHLVRALAREPAGKPAFAEVKDRVHEDYMANAQRTANTEAIDRLLGRYRIVREDVK